MKTIARLAARLHKPHPRAVFLGDGAERLAARPGHLAEQQQSAARPDPARRFSAFIAP